VYDCLTNTFGNGSSTHLGASEMILEDVSFAPGPYATGASRILTEMTYGLAIITTPSATEDVLLIFWDEDDVAFTGFGAAGANMINPAAVPLAVVRIDVGVQNPNFYYQFTSSLTGLPGGGVTVPVGDVGLSLQVAWVTDAYTPPDNNADTVPDWWNLSGGMYQGCASTTLRSTVFGSNTGAAVGGNPASVGSTTASYGRDISNAAMCANIGTFIGGVQAASGNVEHRFINASPARGYMLRFRGDVIVPAPANTPLGCIPDAGLAAPGTVAAGEIDWYSFCLSGAATDAALQFLDVDSEGSAGDVAMAIYNDGGALAGLGGTAADDDSGSGTNAQLSFGVGRRAAVGDGSQYDGRSGELAAGTYYMAVGPAGSTFGSGFVANASANVGGAYGINFATNTNGAALAASVIPQINGVDYGTLDPAANSVAPGLGQATGLRGVLWSTFTLASPVDATHFLDADFNALSTASADAVCYIFDSTGDIVYFSDDEGPAALAQFSLGADGTRMYGANTVPFDGNTPIGESGLAAGTYYMAKGLFATQDLFALLSGHRWHVRGTSGSNLTVGADLYTGTVSSCGSADFDGDGDTGTDLDIEAFFACLGGDCCGTCGSADFDGDGDTGTDLDIEAFFRVLGGGEC